MVNIKKPVLIIIIPCYNEEEILVQTAKLLCEKIRQLVFAGVINDKSSLLFADDGSKDNTWGLINELHFENPQIFCGIRFKENCGQQITLLKGLFLTKDYADITITIDADLQDDINSIDKMLEIYFSGFDIVCGVRSNRDNDSFFKRNSAILFYRFMNFLGANLIENHAEFRLMSKKAVETLLAQSNDKLFLRGIIPQLGYKTGIVFYKREKRPIGHTKYSKLKLIFYAFSAILTFCFPGKKNKKQSGIDFHPQETLFKYGKS